MPADCGYDADWFALITKSIVACIPSKANRITPIPHDRSLLRRGHHIENVFGKFRE
jgi:hypothetical protein